MLSLTLEQMLRKGLPEVVIPYLLYVIRDIDGEEETIFYIGQSVDPEERLWQHIGRGQRKKLPSLVGELIIACLPESMQWLIDLYTLDDCDQVVQQYGAPFYEWYCEQKKEGIWRKNLMDIAENALLRRYNPCLNDQNNVNGTPLPAKYEQRLPTIPAVRLPWD